MTDVMSEANRYLSNKHEIFINPEQDKLETKVFNLTHECLWLKTLLEGGLWQFLVEEGFSKDKAYYITGTLWCFKKSDLLDTRERDFSELNTESLCPLFRSFMQQKNNLSNIISDVDQQKFRNIVETLKKIDAQNMSLQNLYSL